MSGGSVALLSSVISLFFFLISHPPMLTPGLEPRFKTPGSSKASFELITESP